MAPRAQIDYHILTTWCINHRVTASSLDKDLADLESLENAGIFHSAQFRPLRDAVRRHFKHGELPDGINAAEEWHADALGRLEAHMARLSEAERSLPSRALACFGYQTATAKAAAAASEKKAQQQQQPFKSAARKLKSDALHVSYQDAEDLITMSPSPRTSVSLEEIPERSAATSHAATSHAATSHAATSHAATSHAAASHAATSQEEARKAKQRENFDMVETRIEILEMELAQANEQLRRRATLSETAQTEVKEAQQQLVAAQQKISEMASEVQTVMEENEALAERVKHAQTQQAHEEEEEDDDDDDLSLEQKAKAARETAACLAFQLHDNLEKLHATAQNLLYRIAISSSSSTRTTTRTTAGFIDEIYTLCQRFSDVLECPASASASACFDQACKVIDEAAKKSSSSSSAAECAAEEDGDGDGDGEAEGGQWEWAAIARGLVDRGTLELVKEMLLLSK